MQRQRINLSYTDTYTNFPTDTKPVLLCCEKDFKIRRHRLTAPHQIDVIYIPSFINARIDSGKISYQNKKIYLECGAPTSTKALCKKLICLDDIINILKRRKDTQDQKLISDELIHKATMKAYELSGLFTYCPDVKCKGSNGFLLDPSYLMDHGVICPIDGCGKTWCPVCKIVPYHERLNCSQAKRLLNEKNKNDPNVQYLIENTQLCPKCNRAIAKRDNSCDHMECACGTYFCYVCGVLLDDTYNKHVVMDDTIGTYVCPKRLNDVKTGLAKQEIVRHQYSEDDDFDDDDDYRSDEKNFDQEMNIAKTISSIENNLPQDEKLKMKYIDYFKRGDVEIEGNINCVNSVKEYIDTLNSHDTNSDDDILSLLDYGNDDEEYDYNTTSSDEDVHDLLDTINTNNDSDYNTDVNESDTDIDELLNILPINDYESDYETDKPKKKYKLSKNYYNKTFNNPIKLQS